MFGNHSAPPRRVSMSMRSNASEESMSIIEHEEIKQDYDDLLDSQPPSRATTPALSDDGAPRPQMRRKTPCAFPTFASQRAPPSNTRYTSSQQLEQALGAGPHYPSWAPSPNRGSKGVYVTLDDLSSALSGFATTAALSTKVTRGGDATEEALIVGTTTDMPVMVMSGGTAVFSAYKEQGLMMAGDLFVRPHTLDVSHIRAGAGDLTLETPSGHVLTAKAPTLPSHVVNKAYADAVVGGLSWKQACRLKTASALPPYTASGTQTLRTYTANDNGPLLVDGVQTLAGDRLLLDQNLINSAHGGIFEVVHPGSDSQPWVLLRAPDANNDPEGEVRSGMAVFVTEGDTAHDQQFVLTTNNPIVLGTTPLNFALYGAGMSTLPMGGDATGTTDNCTVVAVGGSTAEDVHLATVATNSATSAATASTIAKRDANANCSFNDVTVNSLRKGSNPLLHTPGTANTFVGEGAGNAGVSGHDNTAVGKDALRQNTSGYLNTALGNEALRRVTTGGRNVGVGWQTLPWATTSSGNTAVGTNSLGSATTGGQNTAVGDTAGGFISNGTFNTMIGASAGMGDYGGAGIQTGRNNTMLGAGTAVHAGNAINATAVGYNAVTTANNQVRLGDGNVTSVLTAGVVTAGGFSTTGTITGNVLGNPLTGFTSGAGEITASDTILSALQKLDGNVSAGGGGVRTDDQWNTSAGTDAGGSGANVGFRVTSFGYKALASSAGGGNNVAFGAHALEFAAETGHNVCVGALSMRNVTGGDNVTVGTASLGKTSGTYNIAIGTSVGNEITTGTRNTCVGGQAGQTVTVGNGNTLLGSEADVSSGAIQNSTAIGRGAVATASNQIRLGNSSVTAIMTDATIHAPAVVSTAMTANNLAVTGPMSALTVSADKFSGGIGLEISGSWTGGITGSGGTMWLHKIGRMVMIRIRPHLATAATAAAALWDVPLPPEHWPMTGYGTSIGLTQPVVVYDQGMPEIGFIMVRDGQISFSRSGTVGWTVGTLCGLAGGCTLTWITGSS